MRGSRFLILLLAVLAAAPSAHASDREITRFSEPAVFEYASTSPELLHRNVATASGHATEGGALDATVRVDSKLAGYVPYLVGGVASVDAQVYAVDDEIPTGTKAAEYTAHFVVDHAEASTEGRDGLGEDGYPGANLTVSVDSSECCVLGYNSRLIANRDTHAADGDLVDISVFVRNYGESDDLPSSLTIVLDLVAEAHARLLKGSAAASATVRLLGVSVEYEPEFPAP